MTRHQYTGIQFRGMQFTAEAHGSIREAPVRPERLALTPRSIGIFRRYAITCPARSLRPFRGFACLLERKEDE